MTWEYVMMIAAIIAVLYAIFLLTSTKMIERREYKDRLRRIKAAEKCLSECNTSLFH